MSSVLNSIEDLTSTADTLICRPCEHEAHDSPRHQTQYHTTDRASQAQSRYSCCSYPSQEPEALILGPVLKQGKRNQARIWPPEV
jgi:hypothetical protein